jgi:hypothetical protein
MQERLPGSQRMSAPPRSGVDVRVEGSSFDAGHVYEEVPICLTASVGSVRMVGESVSEIARAQEELARARGPPGAPPAIGRSRWGPAAVGTLAEWALRAADTPRHTAAALDRDAAVTPAVVLEEGVAAAAARAHGLDMELVTAPVRRLHPGESLPPGTEAVLSQLFGAEALRWRRHLPAYGNRSAWGGAGLERTDFMLDPLGHGWHVDRRALDASLLDSLLAHGVRVRCATRVAHCSRYGASWEVALDGKLLGVRARAIVDATGRAARVARSQGARRTRLDRLVAVYWLLANSDERERDSTTLVESVPDGWWYTTPVPGRRRVAAFLTDAHLLPPRTARTTRDWSERLALAPHIANALASAGLSLTHAPLLTDASVAYLDPLTGPGWAAAGDAAVSFDPLSSQGILTALLTGRDGAAPVARGSYIPQIARSTDGTTGTSS